MKIKNELKNKKGITLIALVITIIVLLILAGVSISTLTGPNGLLTRANEAKQATTEAGAREKVQMEVAGSFDNNGNFNMQRLKDNLKNNLGLTDSDIIDNGDGSIKVTVDGYEMNIWENGDILKKANLGEVITGGNGIYTDETGTAIIPEGFAVVTNPDTINNGLVISDKANDNMNNDAQGNQFVWVPVEKAVLDLSGNEMALENNENIKSEVQKEIDKGIYPMAIKKSDGNYIGVLYNFEEMQDEKNNKYIKVTPYSTWDPLSINNGRREPDVVINYDNSIEYLNKMNEILGTEYKNIAEFKSDLQKEFNNMIIKVKTNGGFWVGRYETSNMETKQISVIKGTTEGINNVDWYEMYAKQKMYSTQKLLQITNSSMIWGSQWDQIMIWMKDIKNTENGEYYVTNALGMGNYGVGDEDEDESTSEPVETGKREIYSVKNIFDLAGNERESTLEASSTDYRTGRGGLYTSTDNDCATYSRVDNYPYWVGKGTGSRMTLY